MFSVMKIGTWRRPSCTAIFRPTISGMIVEARDQVRITVRAPERCTVSTFLSSFSSMNGPFLVERDTMCLPQQPRRQQATGNQEQGPDLPLAAFYLLLVAGS